MVSSAPRSLAALTLAVAVACGGSVSRGIDSGTPADGGAPADGASSTSSGATPPPPGGGATPKLVTCRDDACTTPGQYCCWPRRNEAVAPGCRPDTFSACAGHRLGCDDRADCDPGNVCCAEGGELTGQDDRSLVTACQPSCITGAPRWQVCRTDAECEGVSGSCKPYECPGRPALRYCTRPDGCSDR